MCMLIPGRGIEMQLLRLPRADRLRGAEFLSILSECFK